MNAIHHSEQGIAIANPNQAVPVPPEPRSSQGMVVVADAATSGIVMDGVIIRRFGKVDGCSA
ncbi:MAG: hypothetical protein HY673_01260 [Chloroflexi bacterium]|nr:hypothetical protein [Chloroflexota bacterium]